MIVACLAIGRDGARDLRPSFSAGFGSGVLPHAPAIGRGPVSVLCASDSVVRGDQCELYASHTQSWWDAGSRRYLKAEEVAALLKSAALLDGIRTGRLRPAIDAPFLLVDRSDDSVVLFSSCSGARNFYYTVREGLLYAADHLGLLGIARQDAVDPIAVGEVIRFGANYCERSILRSVRRVPFGHSIRVAAGTVGTPVSYIDSSWRPAAIRDRGSLKEELLAAVSQNLALAGEAGAELLFSGGVDSSVLGAVGRGSGRVGRGWFLAMGDHDPQLPFAERGAAQGGFALEKVRFDNAWAHLEQAVAAYSEPTLDFSILPTAQLLRAVKAAAAPTYLLDGTGADAWFGFGSLSHAAVWRRLALPAQVLGRLASRVFSRNLRNDRARWLFPFMVLSRVPLTGHPALGHMCANAAWRQMVNVADADWRLLERDIMETLGRTGPDSIEDDLGQVILSDATMIAVSQFAAKTGKSNLLGTTQTLYPFLMPNIVEIGCRLPANLMVEDGIVKPLLKEIAVGLGFAQDYVYRAKSGFQPPLETLLRLPSSAERLRYWLVEHDDELSEVFTPFVRQLPSLLEGHGRNHLSIKSLYCLWGVLVTRIWLHHFRTAGGPQRL